MKDKKNRSIPRCPGCSRHCLMGCERCKYGKNYFAKHCPCPKNACVSCKKRDKWKDNIEKGGLTCLLLKTAKRIKKGLKAGKNSESELLSQLTVSEKESLENILKKLEVACPEK